MTLTYDKTLKPGDFITAYESGYHQLIDITPGGSSGKLAVYKRVLSDKGTVSKGGIKICDLSFCSRVTKEKVEALLEREYKELDEKAQRLRAFVS